ncbi:MAG: hypothetical protein K0R26_2530 [Bacteroidota bacterium]|jgi:hypothetical protein|nr:hypothetical protein [Bacteroidota bacterium]
MEKLDYLGFEFKLISKCSYASVYYNSELSFAMCIADVEYIPIENFKNIFLTISDLMETQTIHHLLFDKHNLRTFHQPSMEWYFAIWKPSVKHKGLTNHYKILPQQEWFKQAVNAGKHEILKKYTSEILNGIQVTYLNSIDDAIGHVSRMRAS